MIPPTRISTTRPGGVPAPGIVRTGAG